MTRSAASLALVRAFASLWRFRTLELSARVFQGAASPCMLERRFLGYSLHLDVSRSSAQRLLYLEGARYVSEMRLLRDLVAPGATVVDVGANIGYYALLFAQLAGARGRVIAFEPEPDNLVELRLNVEANGLANAEVRPQAVGSAAGVVAFARGINGGVQAAGAADTVEVPMVALDEALQGRVDAIKIDVEGYEGEVLAGARGIIERWRPHLFVEIHPALLAPGHTVDALFDFLFRYYEQVTLHEPARRQSFGRKIASRYLGIGAIETLPSREVVAARARQGRQDTFWAVCRSPQRRASAPAS